MKNIGRKLLALCLCLSLCLPGLGIPALGADPLTLIYSQSVDGEVHLAITGADPGRIVYGVQLDVTLDGELSPDQVRIDPEDPEVFSPNFSTLVKREEGRTTVSLYLVSGYAMNDGGEIPLGSLFAQGLPIAPLSARAIIVDDSNLDSGTDPESQDLTLTPRPGVPAWGASHKVSASVAGGEGAVGVGVPGTARENMTVFVEAVPKAGYQLESIRTSVEGLALIPAGEGMYSFKMPGQPVELYASFKKDETPPKKPLFSDVKEGDWFYPAVEYAYTNGLMNGVGGGKFGPNADTSRAMIVTILYRREGSPSVEGKSGFSDVNDGKWYSDPVTWASEHGIVTGYSGNVFRPEKKISRQEMAAILYRYAQYKGLDLSGGNDLSAFPDQAQVGDFAREPMKWAVAKGYITGKSGRLDPKGSAIRAQSATILQRFFTGKE